MSTATKTKKQNNVIRVNQKYSKSKRRLKLSDNARFVLVLAIFSIICFAFISTLSIWLDIQDNNAKIAAAQTELTSIKEDNERLQEIADGENNEEYIEMVARDVLGYAYPGERVYYAIGAR